MFDGGEKKKNQMAKMAKPNDSTTTIIGQGVFIEGQTFKGVGTVRIDGVYMGEMFVDGHVVIGQTGEIRGDITANSMTIAGTVMGNILCKDELHITETAVTEGDIQTNLLLVDQGAAINGTLSTGRKAIVEPIVLDEALKNMQGGGRKSIESYDDEINFPPITRKRQDSSDDNVGYF